MEVHLPPDRPDEDGYVSEVVGPEEFKCVCGSIVRRRWGFECEACHQIFCQKCITLDFHHLGCSICDSCQLPDTWMHYLEREVTRLETELAAARQIIQIGEEKNHASL